MVSYCVDCLGNDLLNLAERRFCEVVVTLDVKGLRVLYGTDVNAALLNLYFYLTVTSISKLL